MMLLFRISIGSSGISLLMDMFMKEHASVLKVEVLALTSSIRIEVMRLFLSRSSILVLTRQYHNVSAGKPNLNKANNFNISPYAALDATKLTSEVEVKSRNLPTACRRP